MVSNKNRKSICAILLIICLILSGCDKVQKQESMEVDNNQQNAATVPSVEEQPKQEDETAKETQEPVREEQTNPEEEMEAQGSEVVESKVSSSAGGKTTNTGEGNKATTNTAGVRHKNVTIRVDNKTSVYGEPLKELTFTVEGDATYEEFAPYVTLKKQEGKDVGEYNISSTYTNSEHSVTFVTGKYTITPRKLVVEIQTQSSYRGEDLKAPEYVIKEGSIAQGDTAEEVFQLTTDADSARVGIYHIVGNSQNPNYDVVFLPEGGAKYKVLAPSSSRDEDDDDDSKDDPPADDETDPPGGGDLPPIEGDPEPPGGGEGEGPTNPDDGGGLPPIEGDPVPPGGSEGVGPVNPDQGGGLPPIGGDPVPPGGGEGEGPTNPDDGGGLPPIGGDPVPPGGSEGEGPTKPDGGGLPPIGGDPVPPGGSEGVGPTN